MFISVPFTPNPDNWHCIHSAMQSVFKHFLKEFYSIDYLNAMMNPKSELWVWPFQVARVFDESDLFVRVFSGSNLNAFTNINELANNYPLEYINKTSFSDLKKSFDYVVKNKLIENDSLKITDLERLIHNGCLLIVILGSKKHLGKYVVLTGYDSENIYYHDSGPEGAQPNKQISKEDFKIQWEKTPSNNLVIAVYGKKFGDTYSRFHF